MIGTDVNDLVAAGGEETVRDRLNVVPFPESSPPPDDSYYQQLADEHEASRTHHGGSGFGRWTLGGLLEHVSLIYGTDTVWDGRERIQMRLSHLRHIIGREMFKAWDESRHRKIIKGLVFEPSGITPENHVNLFHGLPIVPDPQGVRGCPKILNHIYRLCGFREVEFQWLMKWIAYPLQNPGAKMATSVIMHGSEGPGKSLLWELVVKEIYGEYSVTVGQAQLESRFTGWQSKRCFALCEEVVARNEKAHYKGMLKHLITGSTLMIEEKNLPVREESNHMNSVFLSNSMQPLELDLGDRRYMVLKVEAVPEPGYFEALIHEIKNGGVACFYHHLLQLPMDGFNAHTKPPLNAEKLQLIEAGLPNPVLFYEEWKEGLLNIPYGCCPKVALYTEYKRWCDQRKEFVRRDRDMTAELRRYLAEDRCDIRIGDYAERKTVRVWVTKEVMAEKGQETYTKNVESQCQAFIAAAGSEGGKNANY